MRRRGRAGAAGLAGRAAGGHRRAGAGVVPGCGDALALLTFGSVHSNEMPGAETRAVSDCGASRARGLGLLRQG